MSAANGSPSLVWGCIVCFRPDAPALAALIASLRPQVAQLVLIDNSPAETILHPADAANIVHVKMPRNAGTAGGLNEAWRLALAAGATHLVSFDQDSHPASDFVAGLLGAFESHQEMRLAAIGPVWVDGRNGRTARVLLPVQFARRHAQPPDSGIVEVDHVITSGCLMSAKAFRDVGAFDEKLFLDYTDVEWCLRARARGWVLALAGGCRMTHEIGESTIPLAGRQLAVHSPARTYLQVRNHLLMWRMRWIPEAWLASDLIQLWGKLTALVLLAPQRAERMRRVLAGVLDGARGRGGPPP